MEAVSATEDKQPQVDKLEILKNLPIIPPKLKKKGRPKGRDITVVGVPAKKKKTREIRKKKVLSREKEKCFSGLSLEVELKWF